MKSHQNVVAFQKQKTKLPDDPFFWQVVALKHELSSERAQKESLERAVFWLGWVCFALCVVLLMMLIGSV